ncbi:hypothetical protein Hamer_G025554 [Homarus americanus]|uniref:Uncharacterized protein n=1 Tax=Homarus americanus TaxID=6706 RepID=A0A8J5K5J1_HOMAM|nr:hypothetical protein Hamer_G025554 [Homarus americanus]
MYLSNWRPAEDTADLTSAGVTTHSPTNLLLITPADSPHLLNITIPTDHLSRERGERRGKKE